MESLICTVKSAVSEGGKTTCSVFLLARDVELPGQVLVQHKNAEPVGRWRVESFEKELVLVRVDGELEIEHADYLYGEVRQSEPPPPPSRTQIGFYLTFEGKNWKLASEKKWREKQVDIAGCQHVGDTTIKGKPFRVLRGPDFFAAIPDTAPEP